MFRTIPNKFRIIYLLLFSACFIFSSNTLSWAECSETGNYLICEDWDTGTPPDPWPTKGGETWHGWTPAGYGHGTDNDIVDTTSLGRPNNRCLMQYRSPGIIDCLDLEHDITGQPSKIYVRFYIYLPSEDYASCDGEYRSCHFIFLNTASCGEYGFDFVRRTEYFCKRDPGGCLLLVL